MNKIFYFFCQLIGVTREPFDAVRDSYVMQNLAYRAIAIVLGSIAFGVAVFKFAAGLLNYDVFSAIAFAFVSAFVLFVIERNNIMETIATGQASSKAIATRMGVITMMFGASVALAINAMKVDIDVRIAERTRQTISQLSSDPRYAVSLAAAKDTLAQATKNTTRQSALLSKLNQLDAAHAKAKENEINECQGNTTSDGVKRIAYCGSRSRAHKAEAERIDQERVAVSREMTALGNSASLATSAGADFKALTEKMNVEAARLNKGAGAQLSALYDLFWTNSSVAIILGFYLALSLLPEILVWSALAKPGINEPVLKRMHQMETMVINNRLDVLAESKRDKFTQELPLRHVHVPHKLKAAASRPATEQTPKGNAGPNESAAANETDTSRRTA
jgi:hypothetical protein